MALAFAGARGQGGNALNGLHPCTLPQRALFAAVRRVSPLCASFRAGCECVCGTTGKANVAPTCAKNTKSQSSNAIAILRGGAAEWTRPAACGGASLRWFGVLRLRFFALSARRRNAGFCCTIAHTLRSGQKTAHSGDTRLTARYKHSVRPQGRLCRSFSRAKDRHFRHA